jgi:plasmid maintenance system antidote protein VapI
MAKKKRCEPLDRYCELHKISQAELADRLSIPESTARSLVNGTRPITPDRALEIEGRLGIPRETLRPDMFVKRVA